MKTIRLHGELGEIYGAEWNLDVATPAEALRAIEANVPGFMAHLIESGRRGIGYQVLLDDRALDLEAVADPFGRETLHIVPVIGGASKGIGTIIVGAILAYFTMGTSLIAEAGMSAAATALATSMAGNISVGLILGGLASMLAPTPPSTDANAAPGAKNSYNFNGAQNTTAQGNPVPLGYGRLIVGSSVVSIGVTAEDVVI